MKRRLYVQLFLAFAGIALLSTIMAGLTAFLVDDERHGVPVGLKAGVVLLAEDLPTEGPALQTRLDELGQKLELHLTLWDAELEALAHTGESALPFPRRHHEADAIWMRRRGHVGAAIRLPDGRWLGGVRLGQPKLFTHLAVLLVLGLTVALGCWPLARRITRRLIRLDENVKRLGGGDLSARVAVEGRDEVADLARSFNEAGSRIQQLVEAQRGVLVSASHELRTPMTRLRMALELLEQKPGDPEITAGAARDIEELDALVGDLLLGARLEAGVENPREAVELLGLAQELAATFEATVGGEAVTVEADRKLLGRALRNLLENALRHGGGGEIEVRVEAREGGALLRVSDRGPGVAEAERERIFEPFYRPARHHEGQDGGVGVGLSLVRQIAEHHGGSVRCEAREGGGSVFELRLG